MSQSILWRIRQNIRPTSQAIIARRVSCRACWYCREYGRECGNRRRYNRPRGWRQLCEAAQVRIGNRDIGHVETDDWRL